MIKQIKGRLIEKSPTELVVDCNGIGYSVNISLNTFSKIGDDENIKLFTHLIIKEDSHTLFGFSNSDTSNSTSHISVTAVDQTKHFVDLVIPEIPSIACKMGSKKKVIDRIPLNSPSGSLVYYRSPEGELQTHNYFYPMKLSRLNIQLYDNHITNFYDCNNGHNYFEFEITIVKNTELFK